MLDTELSSAAETQTQPLSLPLPHSLMVQTLTPLTRFSRLWTELRSRQPTTLTSGSVQTGADTLSLSARTIHQRRCIPHIDIDQHTPLTSVHHPLLTFPTVTCSIDSLNGLRPVLAVPFVLLQG